MDISSLLNTAETRSKSATPNLAATRSPAIGTPAPLGDFEGSLDGPPRVTESLGLGSTSTTPGSLSPHGRHSLTPLSHTKLDLRPEAASTDSTPVPKGKDHRVPTDAGLPPLRKTESSASGRAPARREVFVRFKRSRNDPRPSINMWPDVENPPGPCIMTTELTHRAPQIQIGDDNLTVTNDKGYRMAKASHGVVEGAWYYEGTLVNSQGAVRMGWSQISGDLQGPCGLDHYSYSFRSDPPTRFHRSIGHSYGSKFQVGDTLGVLIYLPPPTDEQFEDLLNRRFILGRDRRYVSFNYTSTRDPHDPMDSDPASPEEVLPEVPDSAIAYYLNGRPLGTAFTNLYLGKYYPTVSCYMGAQIRLNFGPDFKYPPPAHWRGVPVESLQMCPPENYLQESQPAEH